MTRRAMVVAAAAVVLLAGCGGAGDSSRPAPSHRAATVTTAVSPPMDADPPANPPPTAVPAGQAETVAVAALQAWASPGPDHDAWWNNLAPLLSPDARVAYEPTDPEQVPALTLTGPPRLEPQTSAWLATVDQDTTTGEYRVDLSRRDDGTWQVERIELPQ